MTTRPHSEGHGGSPPLEADLEQARRFLELIDPHAEAFTFQTFDDDGEKRGHLVKVMNGSLEDEAARLIALNRAGAGVFVTVNETDLQGRRAQNIRRVRAVFADLDGAPLEPVVGCTLTPQAIVESSPGKYHAYWLTHGVPLDQFEPLQSAIAVRFRGDPKVKDLPRVMRLPGFVHRKVEPFRTRILQIEEALPYPAERILAEFPPAKRSDNGTSNGHDGAADDVGIDELIRRVMTAEDFHDALRDLAWCYLRQGMAAGQVIATLQGLMKAAVPEGGRDARWRARYAEIKRTVRSGAEKIDEPEAGGALGRPEIEVIGGKFSHNVRVAIEALRSGGISIYDRGGQLVRPIVHVTTASPEDGLRRPDGAVILAAVGADWLRVRLAEAASWRRFDFRTEKWKACDPPVDIARTIVAAPDEGRWPYLRAIARCPVLLPSGRRIERQGYDPETGLLIDAPGDWPPLPARPTRSDAQAAVETLQHLLRYFPWKSDADSAVALSLILTALACPLLDAVPGHAVDAPLPGSGKSLLVDAAAILAYGAKAAVLDYGSDPDEAAKRLDSALLAGDPILHLDNIDQPLEGAALCQTITQATRRMRLLGSNSMLTVPCNILVTATGNNLTLRGDIVRRMLLCRLDAGVERPEERDIPQDLLSEVIAGRGELVRCAQTIMASYIHAGRPKVGLPAVGSFGDWSRLVRCALAWAGTADPVDTMIRARADDPSAQDFSAVLTAWHEAWGSEPVTVASVIGLAEARAANGTTEFREALALVALRGGKLDGERLGKWLRRHRDCRSGGLTLARSSEVGASGGVKWRVIAK